MKDVAPLPPAPPPAFPWWLAAVLFAAGCGFGYLIAPEALATKDGPPSRVDALRWALAQALPLSILLSAFHPLALPALRAWPAGQLSLLAGLVAAWVSLVPALKFDPYVPAIAIAAAAACPAALRGREQTALGADGLVVWLLLWIPLDLRWYSGGEKGTPFPIWLGSTKEGYAVYVLAVSAVAVIAFGGSGRGNLGFTPPRGTLRSLGVVLVACLAFAAIAIPVGLATGFLENHPAKLGPAAAALAGLSILITVALPEELFFRGVLDSGLSARWGALPALLISSAAFGLMHWNNRDTPAKAATYIGLATLAGLLYALAFRRAGLLAAAVVHALVDLVWRVWLK